MAIKTRQARRVIIGELRANEQVIPYCESDGHVSADQLYERRWALALMDQVLRRLKVEYRTTGNEALFCG